MRTYLQIVISFAINVPEMCFFNYNCCFSVKDTDFHVDTYITGEDVKELFRDVESEKRNRMCKKLLESKPCYLSHIYIYINEEASTIQ